MRLIDADKMIHYQTYDDEHEEFREHTSTIAEFLDTMTDEGCPEEQWTPCKVRGCHMRNIKER